MSSTSRRLRGRAPLALAVALLSLGASPCSDGAQGSSDLSTVESRGGAGAAPVARTNGLRKSPADTSTDLFRATFDEGRTVHEEMSRDGGGELLIGYSSNRATNGSSADPSADFARSGSHSARLSQDGVGGTRRAIRLQRWAELAAHREVYYSAWFYFPRVYHTRSGGPWGWHAFWQFPTSRPSRSYPLFILGWRNVAPDAMALDLTWWPEAGFGTEGPYRGQEGRQTFQSSTTLPVGEWFQVEARYVCDADFGGAVQFWLNGELVFDLTDVRTADPASRSCYTAITSYGEHLEEDRIEFYVDDFSSSLTRVRSPDARPEPYGGKGARAPLR